jgi:YHS domain-containing protein
MLKFIILAAVGYVFYRALKSMMIGAGTPPADVSNRDRTEVDDVLVQDPVCKTYITQRSSLQLRRGGEVLCFCSEQCRDRYIQDHPE